MKKLVLGFFLKMVVADNLKEATSLLSWPQFTELPRGSLWLLLYGFSFRIFADFAGYSLIAQGLARLFGYELPLNFLHPYLAPSLTDFWRRWHLSLSSWLREYLYIPLGGNRLGEGRTYVNLFLVMFLGGLWHGAAWHFVAWGALNGVVLALRPSRIQTKSGNAEADRIAPEQLANRETRSKGLFTRDRAFHMLRMLLTFLMVCVGWTLFRAANCADAVNILAKIARHSIDPGFSFDCLVAAMGARNREGFAVAVAGVFLLEGVFRRHPHPLTALMGKWPRPFRWAAYTALIWACAF